ncbi:AAA family ATPase [Myxococcota bacterium]|nr:AAA family ATPase [Myxococcota bacterium]
MSSSTARSIVLDGVRLELALPVKMEVSWAGRTDLLRQVQAAWMVVDPSDLPLAPRIIGPPGTGKTTLAYTAAAARGQDVFFFQATMDTRPEDLIVQPVLAGANELKYVASALLTAVITGGVCILDEGNRMSEKAWASLAPLFDYRRYVESVVAGLRIHAHADFRFCTTMNEDASTFDLPEYIHSRLQPQIQIDWPSAEEELLILASQLPFAGKLPLQKMVEFLQKAHRQGAPWSVRDGISALRYAAKLGKMENRDLDEFFATAVLHVCGSEATELMGD